MLSILDVLWALLCTFILFLGHPEPSASSCFFPLFQCFEEKEYQTESKWNETFWRSYFWKESNLIDLECTSGKKRGSHEVGGAPTPLGRALHPRGPLVAPLTYFFCLYISIYPKNIGEHNRSGVSPPKASVATESQSRPILAPCRRGAIPLRWPSSSSRCSP